MKKRSVWTGFEFYPLLMVLDTGEATARDADWRLINTAFSNGYRPWGQSAPKK
jgi:hypothetical protein